MIQPALVVTVSPTLDYMESLGEFLTWQKLKIISFIWKISWRFPGWHKSTVQVSIF